MGEMHGLLTIGELTVDDVVVEDDRADWKQAGGGALYSAVGALVWTNDVALNSVVGTDFPEGLLSSLDAQGICLDAVSRSPHALSIGLWLLYESDGTRRQFEKKRGATFADTDRLRVSPYTAGLNPLGVHIAPQSSQGQVLALQHLAGRDVVRTLDLLIEPSIDKTPYLDGSVFRELDAFLPSAQEVRDVWGHSDIQTLSNWLIAHGSNATLAIKRGPDGVDVLAEGTVTNVPTVIDDLIDPTGAGDAFCGGFLAGLVATGDPIEAAIRGSVSASFVCETRGAVAAAIRIDPEIAEHRATKARRLLRKVS
ncbi:carbohydrate kinase family protein [Arthrobacter sp. Hz1]